MNIFIVVWIDVVVVTMDICNEIVFHLFIFYRFCCCCPFSCFFCRSILFFTFLSLLYFAYSCLYVSLRLLIAVNFFHSNFLHFLQVVVLLPTICLNYQIGYNIEWLNIYFLLCHTFLLLMLFFSIWNFPLTPSISNARKQKLKPNTF